MIPLGVLASARVAAGGTVTNVFGTGAISGTAALGNFTTGQVCLIKTPGNITALRFYQHSSFSGTITMRLWGTDGSTLVRSEAITASGVTEWRRIPVTPYAVASGDKVMVGSYNSARYWAWSLALTSSALSSTDGFIVMGQNATADATYAGLSTNGRYASGNSTAVPTLTYNASVYGNDIELTY